MDLILSCILYAALFYTAFCIIFLIRSRKSSPANLPPGRRGLPVIGETLDYVLAARKGKPEKFVCDRMSKHSPDVFRTSLLGENLAVFCGASGNKFLFSGQNKYVTSWWPRSIKKALMFPASVNNSSIEESTKLRSFLPEFLKPETLRHYIPVMDSMAREHLEKEWSPYKDVKVFPLSKKYTFALACRLFISIEDPDHVARFSHPFALATAGLMSVPIDFPGTTFHRAIKGGKMIREELVAIIRRRKQEMSENKEQGVKDLLSSMLLDRDENGEGMSEMDISNKIVGFFIASHDTTSTAITFVVHYLTEFPEIYNEVLKGN